MSLSTRRELAKKLKQIRKQKGITQKEMASQLHISRSCLGNYEIGKRTPDVEILASMITYLNTDWDTLMQDDGSPQVRKA